MSAENPIPSPKKIRDKYAKLAAFKEQTEHDHRRTADELEQLRQYLALSGKVTQALEALNHQLFRELLGVIENKLSIALQEVLEQPIELKAGVEWKRNAASVEFWIEKDGNREDILKGQGGSVANILSVGLRMFALTTLEETVHRRFLVLDEQDCWLHPDLVPRLVKIVHDAGSALGFQVIMISHHHCDAFRQYADRIYQLLPSGTEGVRAQLDTGGKAE
ncbi:MAG: DNA repair protein [Thermodesulfobacteriota bacterium]